MALGYSTTVRNNRMTQVLNAIGTSGFLRIYSGTRPATGGTATTQLAQLPLSATAGTVSGGVLTFAAITADAAADATGTATWARLVTSAGAAVVDLSVGTSGADINFDSVSFVSGGNVAVTSLTFTEGNP
jgi:hypothetical protein